MQYFLDPRQLGQFDDNPEKHLGNSSLGARTLHLPTDQSSAQGKGPSDMLSLDQ